MKKVALLLLVTKFIAKNNFKLNSICALTL
jgi:hypothetical protein